MLCPAHCLLNTVQCSSRTASHVTYPIYWTTDVCHSHWALSSVSRLVHCKAFRPARYSPTTLEPARWLRKCLWVPGYGQIRMGTESCGGNPKVAFLQPVGTCGNCLLSEMSFSFHGIEDILLTSEPLSNLKVAILCLWFIWLQEDGWWIQTKCKELDYLQNTHPRLITPKQL